MTSQCLPCREVSILIFRQKQPHGDLAQEERKEDQEAEKEEGKQRV